MNMMGDNQLRFDGKVALVTGGGRGMGFGHASQLAERGATVIINDISEETAQQAVKELTSRGHKVIAIVSDISEPENCRKLIQDIVDKYQRIDILVNNAGIAKFSPFQDISEAEFKKMIGVHLFGSWFLTQAAWPHMMNQKYGRVVLISSGSLFGMHNNSHYTTAKTALLGLGLNLACEGAQHGIHVNVMDVIAGTQMTKDGMSDSPLKTFILEKMDIYAPATMMAYLCHESCNLNGKFMAAGGKGFGSYFFGGIPGFWSEHNLSPETVRDNIERAFEYETYRVISNAQDCSELVALRNGAVTMGDLGKALHVLES